MLQRVVVPSLLGSGCLVWFGLVYLFIQPATDVALDMSIQITAKEYNERIRYGHLSTIINLGQLKQCYSYIKI